MMAVILALVVGFALPPAARAWISHHCNLPSDHRPHFVRSTSGSLSSTAGFPSTTNLAPSNDTSKLRDLYEHHLSHVGNPSEQENLYRFVVPKTPPRSYPHLFRHYDDISFDSWLRCVDPEDFWASVGYPIANLPSNLLEAPVHAQIAPRVRFLVQVLKGGTGRLAWSEQSQTTKVDEECNIANDDIANLHTLRISPRHLHVIPMLFQCNLDRTVAPWHAYLQHHNLPCGPVLLNDAAKLQEFCNVCASASEERFAQLCRSWFFESSMEPCPHSKTRVESFARAFARGLLPAARNAKSEDLDAIDCTPGQMIQLVVSHGANFLQKDQHGVSLWHWAAGTHHLEAVKTLFEALVKERYPQERPDDVVANLLLELTNAKDGATLLHWACCGMGRGRVGTGGSLEICSWLLNQTGSKRQEVACASTWSKSSPFMWASWTGSLDICKLLWASGADPHHGNNRNQTAAHWAAAAGHLDVCQYLRVELGLDFDQRDALGRTPLDYARLYGRDTLVNWESSVPGIDASQDDRSTLLRP